MTYKAVVFDLDGTLLDSLADVGESMNKVLQQLGFPEHEVEKYKYFIGDGIHKLACRVLPADKLDEDIVKKCVAMVREEYGKRWYLKTRPYEGIPELLQELSSKNIPLVILSNKPDDFTKKNIERFFPDIKFSFVVGERPGIPRKPDPTSALEIAALHNLSPREFLYLGDTDTDMQTARSAGMIAVGVLWGFRQADELLENGAEHLIKKPVELMEFFR